jgi:hypothetical protein
MNPKLFLCLALVLGGSLTGCVSTRLPQTNAVTNVTNYQNSVVVSETPSDTDTQLEIPLGLWKRQVAVNYPSSMKLSVTCRVYRNGVLDKAISSRQIRGTTLAVGTEFFQLGMVDPDAINPDKPQGKVKIFGSLGLLWIDKAPQGSSSGCDIRVPTTGKLESGKEYLVMELRYGTAIPIAGSATYLPTNAEFRVTLHIRADPLNPQEQQVLRRQSNFNKVFKVDD